MKKRSGRLLVILATTLLAIGCKKSSSPAPNPTRPPAPTKTPAPKDLPTKLLEGGYLWHRNAVTTGVDGKDSSYTETTADRIGVINDTEIQMWSQIDYKSSIQNNFEYVSSNDSEVVYVQKKATLTYKKKRNLLVWGRGSSPYYGVPGATKIWGEINKKRLDSERHWHYKYEHMMLHYKRENTDTLANAVVLFKLLLDDKLNLSGADSTGSIYEDYIYNPGPNDLNLTTRLEYRIRDNKIDYFNYNYYMSGGYVVDIRKYTTL